MTGGRLRRLRRLLNEGITEINLETAKRMARFSELSRRVLNAAEKLARIRLTAWRGEGGLLEGDDTLHYAIECWPLDEAMDQFNENGLVIGIYPEARKAADAFSRYKTNNFLAYSLAARHAKAMRWNDALLLNTGGRLVDSCIANLFIIKNEKNHYAGIERRPGGWHHAPAAIAAFPRYRSQPAARRPGNGG